MSAGGADFDDQFRQFLAQMIVVSADRFEMFAESFRGTAVFRIGTEADRSVVIHFQISETVVFQHLDKFFIEVVPDLFFAEIEESAFRLISLSVEGQEHLFVFLQQM